MEGAIDVQNVSKRFRDQIVLNNVSASFEKGRIHGIVGRNGSGKTVLFKMICGLMPHDGGAIIVEGKRIGKEIEVPPSVGTIINEPGFVPNLSGVRNLSMLAGIRGVASREAIRAAIEQVGLDPAHRKHVSKYSMGMKQRLAIAQAIMEKPRLLILDEVFNGLDNRGVEDMRQLLLGERERGATLLISSHNPLDIEILCDDVYEIDAGEMKKLR